MFTTPHTTEEVIAESLGVDVGAVVPAADLVKDLRATPEDFLGLQFELRRQLHVDLSRNVLASTLLNGAPASVWKAALQQGYVDRLPDTVTAMKDDEPVLDARVSSEGAPCSVARLCALVNAHMAEVAQPV